MAALSAAGHRRVPLGAALGLESEWVKMEHIFLIIIGAAALGFFIWLLIPSSRSKPEADAELLDPADSRQIGLLVGLAGSGIADAAVARFALERFEQIHGRKATTRDVGIVVGLMSGGGNRP